MTPRYTYPDLRNFGWSVGIHKAPAGYQHPWLVVTDAGTVGTYSREDARSIWRTYKRTGNVLYGTFVTT